MKIVIYLLMSALYSYALTGTCITKKYDESWPEAYQTYRTESLVCLVGSDTAFVAHYDNAGSFWYVSMNMKGEVELPRKGFPLFLMSDIPVDKFIMMIRVRGKANSDGNWSVYEFPIPKNAGGKKCTTKEQCKQLNQGK